MFRLVFTFLALFFLQDCKQKKNSLQKGDVPPKKTSKYVKSIRINSPEKNKIIPIEKNFTIDFSIKDRFSKIDSVQILVDNKKIGVLYDSSSLKLNYNFKNSKTGTKIVKILSYHSNGQIGIAYRRIVCVPQKSPELIHFKVKKVYPHSKKSFTQGLVYNDNYLYESIGNYGKSEIRKIGIESGKILQKRSLPNKYFGEGITILKNKIYQLTWISGDGFIYDKDSFEKLSTFSIASFSRQGWGITNVKDTLIISNGTHNLFFLSAKDFSILRKIEVCDNNGFVTNLNELEYIEDKIFANVWLTDNIVIIDPLNGVVIGKMNCAELLNISEKKKLNLTEDVLNGIAYNSTNKHLFLTGKNWPKVFEVKLNIDLIEIK